MPFPLLAHQALVLPLKLARRRWFSGTALCIGSIVPDLEYLGRDRGPGLAHRFGGLLVTVPATIAMAVFAMTVCGPVLGRRGWPRIASLFSEREWVLADVSGWLKMTMSAVIGVVSHLVLDGVTHNNGWLTRLAPGIGREVRIGATHTTTLRLLQYSLTGVLSLATLGLVFFAARRLPASPSEPLGKGRSVLALSAAAGAIAGALSCVPVFKHGIWYFVHPVLHAAGYSLFAVIVFALAGVALGTIPLAILDRRSRIVEETGSLG
ncbi:MAG: DUF4184 family protein [Polyangiales bacterium]